MTKHGTARNRGLAAELKALRAKAELTTRQVAKRVGMSIATVNRIENAQREITPEDVAALLAVYGVTGPERARTLVLARNANISGWRETDGEGLPLHLRALTCFESEATRITDVAMLRVPGLLQTAAYIRSALIAVGFPEDKRKEMATTRLRRQEVLRRRFPPNYRAVIDEAALRRPAGSRGLMAEQCRHLAQLTELPNVEIRVIPFEHGSHAGLDGSFMQLESEKHNPIIHVELPQSSMFLDAEHEIRPYRETSDNLWRVALSSAESVKFLRRIGSEYGRE
ncbi:helix-turn-helix domain-containing protein [Actinokineospora sp.]|uniref:helix-turn-helix domain-containing protein n=1 Tax=Actinokineospora sp. TaxID=1872133 RepID=UPI003D6C2861